VWRNVVHYVQHYKWLVNYVFEKWWYKTWCFFSRKTQENLFLMLSVLKISYSCIYFFCVYATKTVDCLFLLILINEFFISWHMKRYFNMYEVIIEAKNKSKWDSINMTMSHHYSIPNLWLDQNWLESELTIRFQLCQSMST
jgi:hypothetical protein